MAMYEDNSPLGGLVRLSVMILLGVLLVAFAGFILPVLGLFLLGACLYGYFYWRRIRRAMEQAQARQAPEEEGREERREGPRTPSDHAADRLDTSGIGDAKEVEFTKE